MKRLLNTLFVTSEDVYLSLQEENVVAQKDKKIISRYPLHTLQNIVSFSYLGASPALMGACAERDIGLSFCTPQGKFQARVVGLRHGNILLRKEQYRVYENPEGSCLITRNMIFGKLYNAKWSLQRAIRDHRDRLNLPVIQNSINIITNQMHNAKDETDLERLRGIEGVGASAYFGAFDELILRNKDYFFFRNRSRRPPLDAVNAMLSFTYSILANECASALEAVGLDSYSGFLHRDKPGRKSLSLDIMEELRTCLADRFVITLINNRVIDSDDFDKMETGAVLLNNLGRKKFLKAWQERKTDTIIHPFLQEKIQWGMVPYVQALLLARYLRGDLDGYPPFLWK